MIALLTLQAALADDFEHGLYRWSLTQQIGGTVTTAAAPDRRGHALRADAGAKAGDVVAKADVVARIAPVTRGGTIRVAFDLRIPAGFPRDSIQLVDLECATCGEGGNPGIRLYLRRGRLRIDRSKLGIRHAWTRDDAPVLAPDRWYRVAWDLTVSDRDTGRARVTLDGRAVLAARGVTARAHVDRVQIGITANSNAFPARVFVDDVAVRVSRPRPPS
ncbi:hypothetical protein [Sphingomonas adhaesiva]|uniref:hypothetical protein n=1 Tax=Sphingomonas adhaesiva TaxID=28212 RepID=UPI002FF82A19